MQKLCRPYQVKMYLRAYFKYCANSEHTEHNHTLGWVIPNNQWFFQRTAKVLIRMHGCTGWSESLVYLYARRHVSDWNKPSILARKNNHGQWVSPCIKASKVWGFRMHRFIQKHERNRNGTTDWLFNHCMELTYNKKCICKFKSIILTILFFISILVQR